MDNRLIFLYHPPHHLSNGGRREDRRVSARYWISASKQLGWEIGKSVSHKAEL